MEKNEKNGVFSRVRSRWRSIFSKKANPVKLRDCNRLTFERILSDPDEQIGTIIAQATVEPITLPNGGGIAYIQETTVYDEDLAPERKTTAPTSTSTTLSLSRRFRRLSSGDINVIRRMTEEIVFDLKKLQNVIYDGNEITGEPDAENGVDRACFKPGPDYPVEQQMMFLRQCIKKIETRPPNMYYLTNGWNMDNFEALFKYIVRSGEDSIRDTLLSIEFRDCIESLQSLYRFVESYSLFKGVVFNTDYVYATVHSKKSSFPKKFRGGIEQFVEVESKVKQAPISYKSMITITSPFTPNVAIIVKFSCRPPNWPGDSKEEREKRHVSVKVDHITGRHALELAPDREKILVNDETFASRKSVPAIMDRSSEKNECSSNQDKITGETSVDCSKVTDISTGSTQNEEIDEYVEMFPTLLELLEKAEFDEKEEAEKVEVPMSLFGRKVSMIGGVTMSSDGCEDTQSVTSSGDSSTSFYGTTDSSDLESKSSDSPITEQNPSDSCNKENEKENPKDN